MTRSRWLMGLVVLACGGGAPQPGPTDGRDVSGNYAITYDNRLTVRLDVGGAVREVTHDGYGGIVDFGTVNGMPTSLDLTQFCEKPEVQCPSEVLWAKVAVTQPDLASSRLDLQKLTVINDVVHSLDAGQRAAAVSGLVDHAQADQFLLGLGANGGSSANCFALGLSLAGGRFTRVGEHEEQTTEFRTPSGQPCSADAGVADAGFTDAGVGDAGVGCGAVQVKRRVTPPNAAVAGIGDGRVVMGFAGGCAFGPVLAGATITLETGYSGVRTGAYDPPPFTPAEVVLPDAGLDAGP